MNRLIRFSKHVLYSIIIIFKFIDGKLLFQVMLLSNKNAIIKKNQTGSMGIFLFCIDLIWLTNSR